MGLGRTAGGGVNMEWTVGLEVGINNVGFNYNWGFAWGWRRGGNEVRKGSGVCCIQLIANVYSRVFRQLSRCSSLASAKNFSNGISTALDGKEMPPTTCRSVVYCNQAADTRPKSFLKKKRIKQTQNNNNKKKQTNK